LKQNVLQQIKKAVDSGNFETIHLELLRHFPTVIMERTTEDFFFFEFVCRDEEGGSCFRVKFGYKNSENRWIFAYPNES
jgi:hypothetical protein